MPFPLITRSRLRAAEAKAAELQQEFRQYKHRNEDLQTRSYEKGRCDAVRDLLPVYDALQRAMELPCADAAYLEGTRMVLDNMRRTLESMGIAEIPAAGAVFDPALHEAVEHITDEALAENTVARVVLTGFTKDGAVLRHALVIVAN